ncbi:HAMP domain-containing protein [Moritella marina ATCC 15381]|uniref:histidine kinase n=2 Tax=Moritella marina TaxID=90736 RepID=A0A5J6WQJ9_MORMI|nr:HAMP domain-containing protein [Moritella marina ATCC 15381]
MVTKLKGWIRYYSFNTLFLKLYIGVTAVIIGSVVFVSLSMDYYYDQLDDDDFVYNASFAAKLLDDFVEDTDLWNMEVDLLSRFTGFTIKNIKMKDALLYHRSHELLDVVDIKPNKDYPPLPAGIGKWGVFVYKHGMENDQRRLAIILPHKDGLLLIIDRSEAIYPMDGPQEWADDEDNAFFFLVGFIFLSIALVLYASVRNISNHVYRLSDASLALAKGDLDTRVNNKIPAPLNQMATSFNKMAESLQHSQHQQRVMANAIAHELRTPLTRIQLVMGLLSDEEHSEYTTALHSDLSRYSVEMEALANDILMLQTIEHNPSSINQPVDLSCLIKSRESEFKRQYPHISISSNIDWVSMDGNPRYLQLIVDNLVKNACLYADSRVKITLKKHVNCCCIIVEDDGDGISPLQREQVLDAFTRLDNSRSRQTGGFGLGLAIVNTAVKTMQGKIDIKTSKLGGAMFIVEFKCECCSPFK